VEKSIRNYNESKCTPPEYTKTTTEVTAKNLLTIL